MNNFIQWSELLQQINFCEIGNKKKTKFSYLEYMVLGQTQE